MSTSCLSLSFPAPSISLSVLSVDRHLGSLHVPDIVNNDEHEGTGISLRQWFLFLLDIYPSVWLLEPMPLLFSIFRRTITLLPTMATLTHTAAPHTLVLWWSLSSHYNNCEGNLKILICILQKISNAKHAFRCMSSRRNVHSDPLSYLRASLPSLPPLSLPPTPLSLSLSVLVMHACNLSTQEAKAGDYQLKRSLVYILSSRLA